MTSSECLHVARSSTSTTHQKRMAGLRSATGAEPGPRAHRGAPRDCGGSCGAFERMARRAVTSQRHQPSSGWRKASSGRPEQQRQADGSVQVRAVTRVHSTEGRDVVTRPAGFSMRSSSLGFPVIDQPFRCTSPWWCLQRSTRLSRSVPPPGFQGTTWWTATKVLFGQPGKRHWRSRRITSRLWAPVGKRLARPSYMVWPNVSSTATTTVASQAMRCTVSTSIRPWCSSSPASSLLLP